MAQKIVLLGRIQLLFLGLYFLGMLKAVDSWMKIVPFLILMALLFCSCHNRSQKTRDPLPSWNDTYAKRALLDFVRHATDKKDPGFVPIEERIAAFDQDGTLWVEKPIYTQAMYCLDRLPQVAAERPEIKNNEPFKSLLTRNPETAPTLSLMDAEKLAIVTLTGMPVDQFQKEVKEWIARAKHPKWNRPYTKLTYLPMQELLAFLRAHEFQTYIVTGGGQDFVRVYSTEVYGIPIEKIIGTAGAVKYGYDKNGEPTLLKESKLVLNDNEAGKPEGIHLMIGKRPVAAFGNSIGDRQMLEYTKTGSGTRFAMLILHDDVVREYAYGPALGLPDSQVGTFTQALYQEAKEKNWIVVSMKHDWKRIFLFD